MTNECRICIMLSDGTEFEFNGTVEIEEISIKGMKSVPRATLHIDAPQFWKTMQWGQSGLAAWYRYNEDS